MTTTPTNAQVDAIADSLGLANELLAYSAVNGNSPTYFLAGYTQNDTTIAAYQLAADPTADMISATICRGLVAEYTNITVREYTYDYVYPTDITSTSQITTGFLADSMEQARVNNPSNWFAAP